MAMAMAVASAATFLGVSPSSLPLISRCCSSVSSTTSSSSYPLSFSISSLSCTQSQPVLPLPGPSQLPASTFMTRGSKSIIPRSFLQVRASADKNQNALVVNSNIGSHAINRVWLSKEVQAATHHVTVFTPFVQFSELHEIGVEAVWTDPSAIEAKFQSAAFFDTVLDSNCKDLEAVRPVADLAKKSGDGIYKPSDEPLHIEGDDVKADAGHAAVEDYIGQLAFGSWASFRPQYMTRSGNSKNCKEWFFDSHWNGAYLQLVATRSQRKCISCLALSNKTVVVTRERGKNRKLMKALEAHGIHSLELPLIEHKHGPDFDRLPLVLNEKNFHWIAVTSPEAASVFLQGWKTAGCPKVKVAVVGSGTREVFEHLEQNDSLEICFTPSKANSKSLAEELPKEPSNGEKVLYPASIKASSELESGLTARGFDVTRLNTYSTDSVKELDKASVDAAALLPVVTFASPTAVKAWVKLISGERRWDGAAACIGSTSAAAARQVGLQRVFYPQDPGLDGWITSIIEALEYMN